MARSALIGGVLMYELRTRLGATLGAGAILLLALAGVVGAAALPQPALDNRAAVADERSAQLEENEGENAENEDEDVDEDQDEDVDQEGESAHACDADAEVVEPSESGAEGEETTETEQLEAHDSSRGVSEIAGDVTLVGGKNCNHGGAVSEAAHERNTERAAARQAASAERDAAKEQRKADRDAAKAERKAARDAAKVERESMNELRKTERDAAKAQGKANRGHGGGRP